MFEKFYDSLVTINSMLQCPMCGGDCISQYPKHFMVQKLVCGKRSFILCVSCDWEISGEEFERSLFCQ